MENMEDKVSEALIIAIETLYLGDDSDYENALWEIVEKLGGEEAVDLLENDPTEAIKKYVPDFFEE